MLAKRISLLCLMSIALPAGTLAAAAPDTPAAGVAAAPKSMLLNPAALTEKAPDTFRAKFETSKGSFVIEVNRSWSPNGADRFFNLVKNGYYDGVKFFRNLAGFMVQFGINGDPAFNAVWSKARIKDDPVVQSNKKGYVTYAMGGPNSRTTQIFVNFADRNTFLDSQGFPPFGKVVEGMDVVEQLHNGYGERPDQGRIQAEGNAYLEKEFPQLDSVKKATIVSTEAKAAAEAPKTK